MSFPGRAVLIFFAAVLMLTGCAKKGDPAEAAKTFFQQLAIGQSSQAYANAAFGFRAQQTEKAFAQTVKEMGLVNQASLEWEAPAVLDREATVPVTRTTHDV